MKLGFWTYQGLTIVFSLLSIVVMPLMVYFNYTLVDNIEENLDYVESTLNVAPIIYFLLIFIAITCGIISIFIAKKEGRRFYNWISGLILVFVSMVSFGMHFMYLATLTFPQ